METTNHTQKELKTESKELGRDLKFYRNACYILMIVFCVCLLTYLLYIDTCESKYFQGGLSYEGPKSLIQLFALFLSGESNLVLEGGQFNRIAFIIGCLFNTASLGIFSYISHSLAKIFIGISKENPAFTLENASYLKKCSSALYAWGGAYLIFGLQILVFMLTGIVTSFFYTLSIIFQHGSQLQQQSDETL